MESGRGGHAANVPTDSKATTYLGCTTGLYVTGLLDGKSTKITTYAIVFECAKGRERQIKKIIL